MWLIYIINKVIYILFFSHAKSLKSNVPMCNPNPMCNDAVVFIQPHLSPWLGARPQAGPCTETQWCASALPLVPTTGARWSHAAAEEADSVSICQMYVTKRLRGRGLWNVIKRSNSWSRQGNLHWNSLCLFWVPTAPYLSLTAGCHYFCFLL